MAPQYISILVAGSVIACALVSGVFLSFSDFVMISLHKTTRLGGVEAMQIINREVFKTVFMVLLMGMSILSLVLIGLTWFQVEGRATTLIIAGGLIYFIGVFVVTMLGNVPLNVQLDGMNHRDIVTANYWTEIYYPKWLLWNHVRTLASGVASICFLLALTVPSAP